MLHGKIPLFPLSEAEGGEGIYLVEFYAAQALAGLLANPNAFVGGNCDLDFWAQMAWKAANAMLAEEAKLEAER